VIEDVRLLESNASPRAASVNDSVREGTAVRTGTQSRSELTFTDQTLTRLGADTVFKFGAEPRRVDLDNGAVLIYVPKHAGGAKIQTGAATAAITGTTVTVEYDRRPPGLIKYTVFEGSMCIRLHGESIPLFAGQQLTFSPDATSLPDPVNVDLTKLVGSSPLVTSFPPLPSAALIAREAKKQQHLLSAMAGCTDNLERAVKVGGAASLKAATADQFLRALTAILIRSKAREACYCVSAAVKLRPELAGKIVVCAINVRRSDKQPVDKQISCEEIDCIVRAAIAADPRAAEAIVRAAVDAEPYARDCIVAAANPCQEAAADLDPVEAPAEGPPTIPLSPPANGTINPGNLIKPPVVSPEQ
jgi:hypothetical protein